MGGKKDRLEELRTDASMARSRLNEKKGDCYYVILIFTFIIGMSCYFSGYSEYIGGKPMESILVKIEKVCYKTDNSYWEIYSKEVNGGHRCNIKTADLVFSKETCEDYYSEKFAVGTTHNVYYNPTNGVCLTYKKASVISIVGFVFLILTVVIYVYVKVNKVRLSAYRLTGEDRECVANELERLNVAIQLELQHRQSIEDEITKIIKSKNEENVGTTAKVSDNVDGYVKVKTSTSEEDSSVEMV